MKEMRDGGLHYLEHIVEAYDKAATAAVESYQGAETRSEGGETQYMARGRYWRPQLKRAEWELLERRMNAEIKSGENLLDEATKWVYADEKAYRCSPCTALATAPKPLRCMQWAGSGQNRLQMICG